jgi:hypothetical protein
MQGAKQEVKVAGSCARCRVGVTKVGRKVMFDWFFASLSNIRSVGEGGGHRT